MFLIIAAILATSALALTLALDRGQALVDTVVTAAIRAAGMIFISRRGQRELVVRAIARSELPPVRPAWQVYMPGGSLRASRDFG